MSTIEFVVNGAALVADASGAVYWPERGLLAAADLHFEKGSAIAARGRLLPPYDTRATLANLAAVLRRYAPHTVLCLGDSFHDRHGAARLARDDLAALGSLVAKHDWFWLAGNHDPAPPAGLGGTVLDALEVGPLTFRHHPARDAVDGEVFGHFHPRAAVSVRGRRVSAPCLATDGRRLVLPAFGAYAGGLDVLDPAIASLFRATALEVIMVGRKRLHRLPAARLRAG